MVARRLADTDTLVSSRDRLVATAKLGPARKRVAPTNEFWQSSTTGINLFLSYSHKDKSFAEELMQHLTFLIRQGVINRFYEREIGPGTEWANEISIALENSQIVLLLISSDFLASDYPYDVETRRAIARYEAGEVRVSASHPETCGLVRISLGKNAGIAARWATCKPLGRQR